MAPSIWSLAPAGLTDSPMSWATTTFFTWTLPPALSTSTSAIWVTYVPASVPQAMP